MKLKFKFSMTWVAMSFIWFLITLFLLKSYVDRVDSSVLPVIIGLPIVIIFYYMLMPLIPYITVKDDKIQIHKNFIVFKNSIKIEDIHHCSIMNKDIVFFTKHQDVYPVHMDWMKKEDMIQLAEFLEDKVRIEDKDENNPVFSVETLKTLLK